MNRRELLKRLAGIPLLGALVPVRPRDFDTANMTARMTYNSGVDLSEQSIEDLLREIHQKHGTRPIAIRPTHVFVRLHEFDATDLCIHCRASAEDVEDERVPLGCWRNRA